MSRALRRTVPLHLYPSDSEPAPGAPVAAHNVHWGALQHGQISVRGLVCAGGQPRTESKLWYLVSFFDVACAK